MTTMTKQLSVDLPYTGDGESSVRELGHQLLREQRYLKLRKFARNKTAVVGLFLVCSILLMAVFAPILSQYDPLELNMKIRLSAPDRQHWFGTDSMGRDVFARVLYGARISMLVGITVGAVSGTLGLVLGL